MARVGEVLPLADVLAVADQVLDVLSAFHARHVIHRDIKPGNLFVTKTGIVKVLDFGLARLRDPRIGGAPTASGIVLGTASYMPPEQAQGKSDQIDARSDVFAVGAEGAGKTAAAGGDLPMCGRCGGPEGSCMRG